MATLSIIAQVAEQRIQESMQRGEFENLEGRGRPLPPDPWDQVPEDLRMAFKILKNSGHLPSEVADAREISQTLDLLAHCPDEQERYRQLRKVNYLALKLNLRRRTPVNLECDPAYHERIVVRTTLAGKPRPSGARSPGGPGPGLD